LQIRVTAVKVTRIGCDKPVSSSTVLESGGYQAFKYNPAEAFATAFKHVLFKKECQVLGIITVHCQDVVFLE